MSRKKRRSRTQPARTARAAPRSDGGAFRYYLLLFLTGAATLSLELLSSRVMTPYFGVSLYIWSGILVSTLAFLAIGYDLGGRLCRNRNRTQVETLLLAAPPASAISIAVACAVYPVLFPVLARLDLVLGSFLASALLLSIPLVGLSAMNPLLIAWLGGSLRSGDAGAGRVFFVSTVGSVIGVLITAFAFIPNATNFRSLLTVGATLALVSGAMALRAVALAPSRRRSLAAWAGGATLLCVAMLASKPLYMEWLARTSDAPMAARVLEEYTSVFGNVKILESRARDTSEPLFITYLQDGFIQNVAGADGRSITLFTHALEKLTGMYAPNARRALVLGLGAGFVPRRLQIAGMEVEVVEINRDALTAARQYFGFEPAGITIHWSDARTFVRQCKSRFDVVIVDLFLGDTHPDYLLTQEFFADTRSCLRERGVVIMNFAFSLIEQIGNERVVATVAAAFEHLWLHRPRVSIAQAPGYNAFLVASNVDDPPRAPIDLDDVPDIARGALEDTLSRGRRVHRSALRAEAITDAGNVFSAVDVRARLTWRQFLLRDLPAHVLVN